MFKCTEISTMNSTVLSELLVLLARVLGRDLLLVVLLLEYSTLEYGVQS